MSDALQYRYVMQICADSAHDGLELQSMQGRADDFAKDWVKIFCFAIIFSAHQLGLSIFDGDIDAQRRYFLLHILGRTFAGPLACHVQVVQHLLKAAVVFLLQWHKHAP